MLKDCDTKSFPSKQLNSIDINPTSTVQAVSYTHLVDFREVKRWYDGYELGDYHVYNPNAVVNAMINKSFQSYWSQTGTYESIVPFINMNFDGLKTAVIEMLSGSTTQINVNSFQNDMVNFVDKDDVLTLLVHLGYCLLYTSRCV